MDKYYIKENKGWSGPFMESEFEVKITGMEDVIFWKAEFCPNHILHPALCSHSKTMTKREEKMPEETGIQTVAPIQESAKVPEESSAIKKTTTAPKQEAVPEEKSDEVPTEPARDVRTGENSRKSALEPEPEITVKDTVSAEEPEDKIEKPVPEKETKPKQKEKDNQTEEKSVKKEESTKETAQMSSKPALGTTREKPVQATPLEVQSSADLPEKPGTPRTGKEERQGYLLKLTVIIIGFLLVLLAGYYVNSRLSVVKYQDTIIRNYIEEMDDRTKEIVKEQQVLQKKMDSLKLLISKELKALGETSNGSGAGNGGKDPGK